MPTILFGKGLLDHVDQFYITFIHTYIILGAQMTCSFKGSGQHAVAASLLH